MIGKRRGCGAPDKAPESPSLDGVGVVDGNSEPSGRIGWDLLLGERGLDPRSAGRRNCFERGDEIGIDLGRTAPASSLVVEDGPVCGGLARKGERRVGAPVRSGEADQLRRASKAHEM